MTRNQFIKLQENFANYAKAETAYKYTSPRSRAKLESKGRIWGISTVFADHVILADFGYKVAIHFEDVKLPKV